MPKSQRAQRVKHRPNPCCGAGCKNCAGKGETHCGKCKREMGGDIQASPVRPHDSVTHLVTDGCKAVMQTAPEWERRALELELAVKVNTLRNRTYHVLIDDAQGRVLEFWPSNGTVWSRRTGHKGKVADMADALELASRLSRDLEGSAPSEQSSAAPASVCSHCQADAPKLFDADGGRFCAHCYTTFFAGAT